MATKTIDKEELEREVLNWKYSHRASERLGQMLLDLHDNILKHKNFNRYNEDIKTEMKGESIVRLMKNGLKSYDPSYGTRAFSYLTQAIFRNYATTLRNYYGRLNRWQKWMKTQVDYDFDVSEGQDVIKEKYK